MYVVVSAKVLVNKLYGLGFGVTVSKLRVQSFSFKVSVGKKKPACFVRRFLNIFFMLLIANLNLKVTQSFESQTPKVKNQALSCKTILNF